MVFETWYAAGDGVLLGTGAHWLLLGTVPAPALDEELCIEEFLEWCHEGMAAAGVVGEIIIVDSSTDRTPELAVANGARGFIPKAELSGRALEDLLAR